MLLKLYGLRFGVYGYGNFLFLKLLFSTKCTKHQSNFESLNNKFLSHLKPRKEEQNCVKCVKSFHRKNVLKLALTHPLRSPGSDNSNFRQFSLSVLNQQKLLGMEWSRSAWRWLSVFILVLPSGLNPNKHKHFKISIQLFPPGIKADGILH